MSREIMQQALNALEYHTVQTRPIDKTNEAIEALRQALAQPEQEPVAWKYDWYGHKSEKEPRALVKDWIASVYTEVSDPTIGAHNIRPLYAAPPRKEWVGLTDAELMKEFGYTDELLRDTAYRVEQILKDRNT